ncbi:MAG: hypothetical protein IJT49_08820 [Clostridia bacterium]|nr:hypothetical protein [Clostridia bacterium]
MKLKKRFVLNSKEDFEKDARLRRILTLTALFSAVIVPLINDGVIYTLVEYTSADIAVLWLNYILRYTVVTLRYICVFVSFAAVFTGIFHYGYKTFKTPSVILIAGSIVKYIFAQFGSYVFCYEHGFIYSAEVTNAAAIIFNYLFLAVFDMLKNAALVMICCRSAKKAREQGLPDCSAKPEKLNFIKLIPSALKRTDPFFVFCLFAAGVELVYEILSNFFSVTLFQLITDGLPETGLDYAALLSGYALMLPFCAVGFVLCCTLCLYFSYFKPAKRM